MYTMKASVAVAKEADAKKGVSPIKTDNSILRLRDEPERQLDSLRGVIGDIRRDGGKLSVESIAAELSGVHATQRAPALLALQQTHGNRYVQRVVAGIQAKLTVGEPGDIYEQEADRVADAVMQMAEPSTTEATIISSEPQDARVQRACSECEDELRLQPREEEEELLQTKKMENTTPEVTHDLELQIHALQGGGQPLAESERAFFEPRFGYDFGQVQVHTDAKGAESARVLNARAYTIGGDMVFGAGQYRPGTVVGKRLLAHELMHVVQQNTAFENYRIQREEIEIRSPVFEEAVTQISTVEAAVHGRPLRPQEVALARPVFGNSVDYARVRLIPTRILEWRTVGNTIRVSENFTITDSDMAETFIHEMTHVWQYQHDGTSYISTSLSDQIVGAIRTGSRNAAYEYQIVPGKTFFEYRVEQQAYIVQRYFGLLRDQADPETTPQRRAQIAPELSLHQPLIDQMRAALPRPEVDILRIRASEVMQTPGGSFAQEPIPPERRLNPIRPLLELRF